MNFRRGIFRLWLLASVLFVIAIAALSYQDIMQEFEKPALNTEGLTILLPLACKDARGAEDTDYQRDTDHLTGFREPFCWYTLPAFRRLYPEYADLKDHALSSQLYRRAGQITWPKPWLMMAERTAVALAVPIAVFVFGAALMWVLAGFSRDPKT